VHPLVQIQHPPYGRLAEWLMAIVLKTINVSSVPGFESLIFL